MAFEFGDTSESRAFFKRNPKYLPAFERLIALSNKAFGREIQAKNRLEYIGFWLGHACRADFTEVTFLSVNGYAEAAFKLLRGLYERAVNLAYLIKNPDKAERFFRFAAIQEHKAMQAALKLVSEEQFDAGTGQGNSAAQIRQRYEEIKPEFQITLCKKCGNKGTQFTWDIDLPAMVHRLPGMYQRLYMVAYALANLQVHATLASTLGQEPSSGNAERRVRDAEFALYNATIIILLVIRSQNELFSLSLDSEIETCERETVEVFEKDEGPRTRQ